MSSGRNIVLETERLILATPVPERAEAARDFFVRNAAHLKPWSPPAPAEATGLAYWQDAVDKARAALDAGTAVRLWMSPRSEPQRIIGSVCYSQIARGPFCNAVLGYQIDAGFEGRGLMKEALTAANRHMFDAFGLHRIAANYRPENRRSGLLLAKLGFTIEGYARNYLFIDGEWRDHILTAKINPASSALPPLAEPAIHAARFAQ
jgi:ribosomal-protein-alanine N-acetyltransferase